MSLIINFDKLREISTKPSNKTKMAINESKLLTSYMITFYNLVEFATHLKANEMALFINSINHWINNKKNISTRTFKPGDVIEIECGLNYSGELAYRHWAIVLENMDKKILCVPTTSGKDYKKNVYTKKNGLWYYVLVGKNEGFNHDCVALLDNMEIISKKRIVETHGNMLETETGTTIFRSIRKKLVDNYFQKEILEYMSENDDLRNKIKEQREIINGLHKTIRRYKTKK